MQNRVACELALSLTPATDRKPAFDWAFRMLPIFFAIMIAVVLTFASARTLFAQSPTTFNLRHEVQRSGMLVIDLDGDGKLEIIYGSLDGYVTVISGLTYDIVWDKNMADYLPGYSRTRIQASLAAADLDGDGKVEIVIATGGVDPVDGDGPGALIVLTYVGGSDYFRMMPGWPVLALDELGGNGSRPDGHPDGYYSTPSLGDIDGDGKMEIVIGGMDRRLHAFHHDGTYVLGWPMARDQGILRESRSTASLYDIDGDGILDILIGSNNYGIPSCANPYHFFGLRGNATLLPGFPFSATQNIESSPALGDINNDGGIDIVFGTGDFNESCNQPGGFKSDGKKVYAIDRFGQPLPGWPVQTNANMLNSPALGDLDNDGTPEVVIHTQDTLYAWHGDGSLVQGFPVQGEYNLRHAAPVLADIDGDSKVEIVLASGQVYGPTGQLEQQRNKLQSRIVIIDQDGDGLLETVGANHFNYNIGLHLKGYIFQETGPATGAQPWPMFHRTMDRRGSLPNLFTLSGRVVNPSNQGVPNVKLTLNSGQIAYTGGQGNFIFGSLPAGSYVVTPDFQDNVFAPRQRSVTVTGNAAVPNFVMEAPLYDIRGRVMHPNGSGVKGVTVQLNPGASVKTGADGTFVFSAQHPGQYTITPKSPDFNYVPGQLTLTAEKKLPQFIYALPKPIEDTLLPNGSTMVEFVDTQGLPTRITFPEGLGEQQALITPILAAEPKGYLTAGHAVDIQLSSTNAQSGVVGQSGEPLAIEIQIQYNTADLQSLLDAGELVLLWESSYGWVDATATCPSGSAVDNNTSKKVITVPVCQWGTYGLFAPVNRLYFPALASDQ